MFGVSYGTINVATAYLMAFLGSALGLRCVVRSVHYRRGWRPGWLTIGAIAMGSGIWMMHFIAMMQFNVPDATITFDPTRTVLSLVIAVLFVGAGLFLVGYGGTRLLTLTLAGTITGLGVAGMHYVGMSAMYVSGTIHYEGPTVVLSIVIAIGAAVVALWSAVSIRGFLSSLAASLVMALAISGMHYTAMAAMRIHVHASQTTQPGESALSLMPLLILAGFGLMLASAVIMFDPLFILGSGDWDIDRRTLSVPPSENIASDVFLTYPQSGR